MLALTQYLQDYLEYCRYQKGLTSKTCKAYRIDLTQLLSFLQTWGWELSKPVLSEYITELHKRFQPKSANGRQRV